MTALLALLLLVPAARASEEAKIVFRADPRLELVGAVELMNGGHARRFVDPGGDYARAVRARLKPFKDDPAFKLQAAFPKAFDFPSRCDIIGRTRLDLRTTTFYYLPDPTVNAAGGREKIEDWLTALRGLETKAKMDEFFAQNRAALEARAEPYRDSARRHRVVRRIEDYVGRPFTGTYTVFVSPFMDRERMLDSVWPRADGSRELYTVIGADAGRWHRKYYLDERFPSALWHQLAHGLLDSRVEAAFPDDLARRTDGRREPCFGDWQQCVKENLVRAVTARLLELDDSPRAARRFLHNGDQGLYPLMPELLKSLQVYEKNRDKYPTLDSYLPILFQVFPEKKAP